MFRRSLDSESKFFRIHSRMGLLTSLMFISFEECLPELSNISHTHYSNLSCKALELGLNCVVKPTPSEKIVSPHF